jgi:hypothetical protein
MKHVLLPTLIVCFSACNALKLVPPVSISAQISSLAQTEGTVICFADLTDFDWNTVYIFGPYTPATEVSQILGFEWSDYKKIGLESSDTFNLIVFTKDKKILRVEEHPRNRGDFAPASINRSFSKTSAIFKVFKENDWVVIKPKEQR